MRVVIVIPTLNEAKHIAGVVDSLRTPGPDGTPWPIWVLDGGSTDGTVDIVRGLGLAHVTVTPNPGRTQSHALNLAADRAAAEGTIDTLIRADAHATYPAGFVTTLMEALEETGADSVVVTMETLGGNAVQNAAAVLFASWLGHGGSPHRSGSFRGFVAHGHHAAFRLSAFRAVGGYDTRFAANEDAELDVRLLSAGSRIFLENRCPVGYIPRSNLRGTWRQMRRNGRYRIMTAAKHRQPLGLRQMIPIAVAPTLAGSLGLGGLLHPIFFGVATLYAGLVFSLAVAACRRAGGRVSANPVLVTLLAIISHIGFSVGAFESLMNPAVWALAKEPRKVDSIAGNRAKLPRPP